MEQDKVNAYMTLYTSLVTLCKLAAPMIPFMTEEIYQNLVVSVDPNAPESIHLCDYPKADPAMIDKELEANMKHVLDIVVLGRAARNESGIKNRQPIGRMIVKAPFDVPSFYQDIITDELNVKKMELSDEADSFISYTFKPQMRTVGPKFGKLLGGIRKLLSEIDGKAAMKELNEDGTLALDVNGTRVVLEKEDLLIDMAQTEGFETQSYGGITVVLDKALTPELIEEGFVRELVSKIQTMRKEAGFEVMDRITVYASGNEKIEQILRDNEKSVAADVLADGFIFNETDGYVKEWKINTEKVTLGVKKN
jgi:isoleucyl-tRNA synthetase